MYRQLFKQDLIPKHHFILHYPNVIRKLGPLKKLWTMRFEAKHKALKTYSSVITAKKNICLRLCYATKLQFDFAYRLCFGKENRKFIAGPKKISNKIDLNNFQISDSSSFFIENFNVLKHLEIKSTLFKENYIITCNKDVLTFYKIVNIVECLRKGFFFLYEKKF